MHGGGAASGAPELPAQVDTPAWKLIATLSIAGALAGLLVVIVYQWTLPSVLAHIRDGRLRGLAVTTAQRTPRLPEASPPPEIGLLIDRLRAGDSECDQLIEDCLRQLENSLWMPHLRQALRCCPSCWCCPSTP